MHLTFTGGIAQTFSTYPRHLFPGHQICFCACKNTSVLNDAGPSLVMQRLAKSSSFAGKIKSRDQRLTGENINSRCLIFSQKLSELFASKLPSVSRPSFHVNDDLSVSISN